jgi:hypothetical protein
VLAGGKVGSGSESEFISSKVIFSSSEIGGSAERFRSFEVEVVSGRDTSLTSTSSF